MPETTPPTRGGGSNHGNRPGDDYNARGDWFALLTAHGWRCVGSKGYETYWKRPGKDERGWSATVNYADLNLLYIFSSNAWPFKSGRGYSLFSAYAILNHGGDFRAASIELALMGYGEGNSARPAVTERVSLPLGVTA